MRPKQRNSAAPNGEGTGKMSEQNRRLRAAGIAALAWAGLAAVWCVLVPGGAAELPQGVSGTLRSLLVLPLAEELVFRGIIAQTLLERYGTARAGVWKACLVSGALFGAAHLSNLLGSAPFGVLMQCVFAASLGVMLAAIYFRTGNLWVTVFLHSAMDIAAMLIGGLYGTTSVAESVSGYDASRLLSVAVYLIPTVFLLRKKKLPEVQLYWGGIVKN